MSDNVLDVSVGCLARMHPDERNGISAGLTSLQGASFTGRTERPVTRRVKCRQLHMVSGVGCQVLQVHGCIWNKQN